MWRTSFILGFFVLSFGWVACDKGPDGPAPELTLGEMSKLTLVQNGQDSLYVTVAFEDQEGDLGSDNQDNVFVSDARDGQVLATYRIPNNLSGSGNYRKGEITLVLYSGCCIYNDSTRCVPSSTQSTDVMRYRIEVQDQAGNRSNALETPEVLLNCN